MRTLELEREAVITALENADLDEDALREDYSGRGMYGATCLGLVHRGDIGKFYVYLAEQIGAVEACDMSDMARVDSMGLDIITYWPGVTLEDESTE